jgi:3-deoxy-D-manno-octulosonic-acid transferase
VIWLYRILFPLAALISAPHYLRRMLKRGGYGKNIGMRLGFWPKLPSKKSGARRIWIQAVSVGEVVSISPLLKELALEENIDVVLSCTTSTGLHVAQRQHRENIIALGPFPIDWLPFSSRGWERIRPDLVAMVDSELWPEHMEQARKRNVPIVILNARLSDRTFSRLGKSGFLRSLVLPKQIQVFAASERQAERWNTVGIATEKIKVTGNLKLDAEPKPPNTKEATESLKKEFGFPGTDLVLAGISTWPGEEQALVEAFLAARAQNLAVRLLIIPRHAERKQEVADGFARRNSLSIHFRSNGIQAPSETDVYVGDTTGELGSLIRVADLAFIGKTLPPNAGGQNPIEPAARAIPLLFGPNHQNFQEVCKALLSLGAAVEVGNQEQLEEQVIRLLGDAESRRKAGQAARQWKETHSGATRRTLEGLIETLKYN